MRETYTEPEDKITPREGRGSESLNVILHLPRELKVSTDEKLLFHTITPAAAYEVLLYFKHLCDISVNDV